MTSPCFRPGPLARRPGYKAERNALRAEISGRKQRPVDIQQETRVTSGKWCPGQHLGANQNTAPAAMDGGEMLLQRSLCGWWYRGSIREIGTSGNSGARACSSCSVPIPTGQLSDAWSRRKDTGAGSGAGCRNGGSVDGAAPGTAYSNCRSAAFRYPAAIVAAGSAGAKPRRLRKGITWLSACRCWRIRLISARDRPPAAVSHL